MMENIVPTVVSICVAREPQIEHDEPEQHREDGAVDVGFRVRQLDLESPEPPEVRQYSVRTLRLENTDLLFRLLIVPGIEPVEAPVGTAVDQDHQDARAKRGIGTAWDETQRARSAK